MVKKILATVIGLISAIYLINPTAGILEIIPDNMPFLGNLDEATATALLIASLRHLGIDITNFIGKDKENKNKLK